MSIGLYDSDVFTKNIAIPNLEIMKLASYYRMRGEICQPCTTFSPDRYSLFYYRQDYPSTTGPPTLFQNKKVRYGGRVFSPKKYVQMPDDIEFSTPITSIYRDKEDFFLCDKKTFKTLMNSWHLRISLDGKNICEKLLKNPPKDHIVRTIFFHDYNLNEIDGSKEIISLLRQSFMSAYSISIGTKFPILCNNSSELLEWINEKFFGFGLVYQLDQLVSDEEFYTILNKIKERHGTYILLYNPLKNCSSQKDFLQEYLPKIFKQAIFCRNMGQKINILGENHFSIPRDVIGIIELLNSYCHVAEYDKNRKLFQKETLYKFVTYFKTYFINSNYSLDRNDARRIFDYIKKENPSLFKDFYLCKKVTLRNGEFDYD